MAEYFSVQGFIANRLEFREGVATGRLREPVIRPRGPYRMAGQRFGRRAPS